MEIGNRTYQAYYRGRTIQIQAQSSYQAQIRAAEIFGARKSYQVSVVLADVPVDTASLG
jgi:NOL1/NOP2/fmu family ribosome biogenesis protein